LSLDEKKSYDMGNAWLQGLELQSTRFDIEFHKKNILDKKKGCFNFVNNNNLPNNLRGNFGKMINELKLLSDENDQPTETSGVTLLEKEFATKMYKNYFGKIIEKFYHMLYGMINSIGNTGVPNETYYRKIQNEIKERISESLQDFYIGFKKQTSISLNYKMSLNIILNIVVSYILTNKTMDRIVSEFQETDEEKIKSDKIFVLESLYFFVLDKDAETDNPLKDAITNDAPKKYKELREILLKKETNAFKTVYIQSGNKHKYSENEEQCPVFSGSKMILLSPSIEIIKQNKSEFTVISVDDPVYKKIYRAVNDISGHSVGRGELIQNIIVTYNFFWKKVRSNTNSEEGEEESDDPEVDKIQGTSKVLVKSHVLISPRLVSAHEAVRDSHIRLPKDKEFSLPPDAMSLYVQAIGHKIKLENMVSEQSVATRYDLRTVSVLLLNACRFVQKCVLSNNYI